jgi:DNA-directed RNA polymerase III subunit RPC6
MLFHLTASVEVTGGVWYTDHEFDSAFVRVLLDHIYNYIAKQVYGFFLHWVSSVIEDSM